ncbi:cytochrome c oxidase assembly protein COX16 homolog, mitochondrial [Diachasmimorpha longicaudata]|uniref:cytochrome c oxidase assembly protein COX16 homolog, mitochondrial n=1 Tax=Diachasmimorpha longicaudata TaxID=58733 RepID=UPI0030B88678
MMLDTVAIKNKILELSKRRSIKHGLPFVLFIIGGSFGLREFTALRYQYRQTQQVKNGMENTGLPMKEKSEMSLEAIYKTIEELNTDNWENKRIERPWEEETPKT